MAPFSSVPPGNNGFGQAAALVFNSHALLNKGNDDLDTGGQISKGHYLNAVLDGTSPVEIIDHGIGPFEDKTRRFQPSSFGVVCIANVCHSSFSR
jgi:hypothetical protein